MTGCSYGPAPHAPEGEERRRFGKGFGGAVLEGLWRRALLPWHWHEARSSPNGSVAALTQLWLCAIRGLGSLTVIYNPQLGGTIHHPKSLQDRLFGIIRRHGPDRRLARLCIEGEWKTTPSLPDSDLNFELPRPPQSGFTRNKRQELITCVCTSVSLSNVVSTICPGGWMGVGDCGCQQRHQFIGLAGGPLLRRFSFRQVALLGCLLTALGVTFTSQANSYSGFIFTYCVLLAVGQGLLYPATSLALNSYFCRRRSTAMGLTIAVTGLGPVVTPLIVTRLIEGFGVTGAVLVLGGVSFHSLAAAALLRPLRKKKSVPSMEERELLEIGEVWLDNHLENKDENIKDEVQTNGETLREGHVGTETCTVTPVIYPVRSDQTVHMRKNSRRGLVEQECRQCQQQDQSMLGNSGACLEQTKRLGRFIVMSLDLTLLRDPVYLNIVVGMGLSFVAELNFNMLMPFILADLAGLSRKQVAIVMSVQASLDITARFLVPPMADRWQWKSLLAHLSTHYHLVLAISVLLGLSKGIKAVFQALIIPNYVPLERLPAASGLLMVNNGVISLVLGPLIGKFSYLEISGFVRDTNETYIPALYTTSALSMSCIVLWVTEIIVLWRKSSHLTTSTRTDTSVMAT
uniref:(California timema) hypothetical protein n=1 Tax=Timema californicum TaxID=61474 RepID=A0A7R9J8V1_TIMCA|nr:unnamed protein product [Timema californicum]